MSKKSVLLRNIKRIKLNKKFEKKKEYIKYMILNSKNWNDKLKYHYLLQKLPNNASKVRIRKRCPITGRQRGFCGFFGISRISMRSKALNCYLSGLNKSSW
ncbi:30S ribosomal protein S14 [Candidatus Vidania fulgoroideorum]